MLATSLIEFQQGPLSKDILSLLLCFLSAPVVFYEYKKAKTAKIIILSVFLFQAREAAVCEQHQHQTRSSVVTWLCAGVWHLLNKEIYSKDSGKSHLEVAHGYRHNVTFTLSPPCFMLRKMIRDLNLHAWSQRTTFYSGEDTNILRIIRPFFII